MTRRLFYTHMTLHEEPTWMRHAWVRWGKVRRYRRGGWCVQECNGRESCR